MSEERTAALAANYASAGKFVLLWGVLAGVGVVISYILRDLTPDTNIGLFSVTPGRGPSATAGSLSLLAVLACFIGYHMANIGDKLKNPTESDRRTAAIWLTFFQTAIYATYVFFVAFLLAIYHTI